MQMLKGRHVQQRRPCDVLKAQLGSVCQTRFNLLQAGRDIHRSISSAPGSLRAASVAQRRSALCRPFFLLRKVLGFRTFAGCSIQIPNKDGIARASQVDVVPKIGPGETVVRGVEFV